MKKKTNSILTFPRTFVVCLGGLFACASSQTASAVDVPVPNGGFETNNVATNGLSQVDPTGWTAAGGLRFVGDGSALPGISGGHSSDQYYLAANAGAVLIRQDTALQWSSLAVGDTLTVGAWTTYRSDLVPDQNIAYFWLNDNTGSGLNSGAATPGGGGFNVTQAGLLGGGAAVAAGVWTHREWTYIITPEALTNATDATPWGAVNVQVGFAGAAGTRQIAFDDVTLTHFQGPPALNESLTDLGWTLPAGTNLLQSASLESAPPVSSHGVTTSSSWSTLTDGQLGTAGNLSACVAPNNGQSVIFPLDLTANTKGYDLTSMDFYGAWADSGRDNLDFTVRYSTWDNPTVFLPLAYVANHTVTQISTHTRLTPASGFLASGVAAIQFIFNGQEAGWVGYREFIALGQATPLTDPLTWTGNSGAAGNASWVITADNNWSPGNFDPNAPLYFTSTGNNRNITAGVPISASSMTFFNDDTTPYTFNGSKITVANAITSATGNGAATFNGPVNTAIGVMVTGPGRLTFNGDLESPGLNLTGSGGITLNALYSNSISPYTGIASVNNGTLNIGNDTALISATLSMTGGTANFTTSNPYLLGLSGTGGTVNLGNTALTVGLDSTSGQVSTFAGNISQASGSGGFTKTGPSSLTLSGSNTYTGVTHVEEGQLQLARRLSLYGGNTASWTSGNIVVDGGATLGFNVGSADEFDNSDLNALGMGNFASGSTLGITTTANFTLTRSIDGAANLYKKGATALTLTGPNSYAGITTINTGTINAAGGTNVVTLPGDVYMGDGANNSVFMNMAADNQFGPNSVLHVANVTFNGSQSKVQLRGTHQTIAGLDSPTTTFASIIQNDDATVPDYVANPTLGAATLTINTPVDTTHSFYGLIREQVGPAVSIIKNGLGTQEFRNNPIQSYSYSGPTIVNEGILRLNFAGGNSGFGSDITVNGPATLQLVAGSNFAFSRLISGAGKVLVTGNTGFAILTNGNNSWSGGTTIDGGRLSLVGSATEVAGTGAGTGTGQTCIAGAMDPSNVINLINGGVVPIDYYAALGQSTMLPQYAPSIHINEGTSITGGTSTVAFVPNITLNGGKIYIAAGNTTGGFNTNLAFVGTVIVGGTSSVPAEISTPIAGATANASLGSLGLPGTTFQVADVTTSSAADLLVSSILQDVKGNGDASPLIKTGPGTLLLSGANTYTGDTTVTEGTLAVSGNSIADTNKLVINGGIVDVATPLQNESVNTLYFGTTQQLAGTYGSTGSTADYPDDSRFSGTGIVTVTVGPITDPYTLWSAAIPNPAERGPTADPDHDGLTNLQEYLFGTSPIANDGSLTTFQNTPGGLIVRWFERASGTYTLQESTTLTDPWPTSTAVPSVALDQGVPYSTDYTRMEAIIPVDSAHKFVRVQASE